jgi:hypothetical protein
MSFNVPNPNLNPSEADKSSGINKHLYSTNPDLIVGENIYSKDATSINKEESYQTLDNKTVPVDTGEKVNPFNVKGVPGCRECGGSGWKETKRHPHPCNECAKRTVPVIDTYLTKVGHTSTPIQPIQETQVREVQEVREVTQEVPVTREVRHIEEVPVKTQVPVTRYEEVIQNVPVERVDYVTENVPVTIEVPVERYQETTYSGNQMNVPVSNPEFASSIETIPVRMDEEFGGYQEVNREVERNRFLVKDSHIHDEKANIGDLNPITTVTGVSLTDTFAGIPGCKECGGNGWRRSKLTGAKKPCTHCVSITGNCPLCGNTGRRLDKDKKCKCIYAK